MIISENVVLIECPEFGVFDKTAVPMFLRMVQDNFYRWLGGKPVGEKRCLVYYQDHNPAIYSRDGYHIIKLHTHGNYWCQWVYQYAHEFCHHLIKGPMLRDVRGLVWFEETVCELSSLHNLYEMAGFCEVSSKGNLRRYAPSVRGYLDDHLSKSCQVPQGTCAEYLQSIKDILAQPEYQRPLYSEIAFQMFPLFLDNPCLWKIILHFGDMRRWPSLEVLFRHLRETEDDSYSLSLEKLKRLLIG